MKIAFVIEYFPPFAAGGSEWSTYYLAKELSKLGQQIVVVTPNYGAKKEEKISSIKILRYPIYLKLKNANKLPGHFTLTNPIWIIWTALNLFLILKKEKPDIIHIHGKYSLPSIFLANLFLKKPLVATVRDYMPICNYGICLMSSDKACNFKDYFFKDLKMYMNIYMTRKDVLSFFKNLLFAIWGRISKNVLKFSLNHMNYVTCLSRKQRNILLKNGVKTPLSYIYTNYIFDKLDKIIGSRNILFVGRLTYGKGIGLFLSAIPRVKTKFKGATFTIIGDGPLARDVLRATNTDKCIKYIPHVNHSKLKKTFRESLLLVVPSIWPDPLPRVAMEAISTGTPVVATNAGGLPEIVKNNMYGYISKKNPTDLANKILLAIKNEQTLRGRITADFDKLKENYGQKPAQKYVQIYKNLQQKSLLSK